MAEKHPMKRTHYCGTIRDDLIGRKITVYGWVSAKRELGAITFIDLRDREGIVQVMVAEGFPEAELVKRIGREYVLEVTGTVALRAQANPDLATGTVEIKAESIRQLAAAVPPPFFPDRCEEVSEELRFKYRYLDLRSLKMQGNFQMRSRMVQAIRNWLCEKGFIEIETPILSKATPEGARDYLVPSRIYKGRVFALPQSPQLFKQILMVAGFERYFQIARCFRDEDLRADRQPEFTQVDVEMSFAEPDELFGITEEMMRRIFAIRGLDISLPFPRMSWKQAMEDFGSDKPDLRNPLKVRDLTSSAKGLGSNILNGIIDSNGCIKGIVAPTESDYSRKFLDETNETIKKLGGKGVVWMRTIDSTPKSSLKIEATAMQSFFQANAVSAEQMVFLIGDRPEKAAFLAGKLREHLGNRYIRPEDLRFTWIVDFPLFFKNEEENRLDSNHHPFTSPRPEDIAKLDSDPLAVLSVAYDLVLNGTEVGGGSKRIHDIELQRKVFRLLDLNETEIAEKFGFFLDALTFGAPPHLGIALGVDRLAMLLVGERSIREMIAFPKTTSSLCLLTGSPSPVAQKQLDELGIQFKKD